MTSPGDDLLASATAMGAVTLRVHDLDAMTAYYRDAVLLDVRASGPERVVLGRGTSDLLVLEHAPELRHASARQAGLFHTALLFETATDLAAVVHSVATRRPGSFVGSADHLVSEAFYFTDPEGNGLELYVDRARSAWSWAHGQVEMASIGLDPNRYLATHLDPEGAARTRSRPATVGHVHLCVGDVATARRFYVDQLGFSATAELGGSALFVSAGGYHHHMAMNTWTSAGAGRRRRTLGLGLVRITLPTADDLGALDERLRHHGVDPRDTAERTLELDDPWSNRIAVTVEKKAVGPPS